MSASAALETFAVQQPCKLQWSQPTIIIIYIIVLHQEGHTWRGTAKMVKWPQNADHKMAARPPLCLYHGEPYVQVFMTLIAAGEVKVNVLRWLQMYYKGYRSKSLKYVLWSYRLTGNSRWASFLTPKPLMHGKKKGLTPASPTPEIFKWRLNFTFTRTLSMMHQRSIKQRTAKI